MREFGCYILFGHVETKVIKHTFRNTSYSKAERFCSINNFDVIENGGSSLGSCKNLNVLFQILMNVVSRLIYVVMAPAPTLLAVSDVTASQDLRMLP